MPLEWTGSGPELLLSLDRQRDEPLRHQLESRLRALIRDGRLTAGEKLPSSRVLAAELGVSRGLVTEAYAQLQAEGYLLARDGSATRVSPTAQPTAARPTDPAPPATARYDFKPGVPDLSSFPRERWARSLRRACRDLPTDQLGYADPVGNPTLRAVVAAYLRRVRGAAAQPEHTVICAGFAQGAQLVLRALASQGVTTLAVEDPGDPDQGMLAAMAGLDVVPIAVDEDGIDTAALAASDAGAVILTPAHQTPTGGVLAAHRRRELIAWASERNATIIEDDYDAEFRYDREPIGAVQGLAPDRTALLGSVSKSLAPAMRLGWIICPPHLHAAVAREKYLADRGSPGIDQVALADLIESGAYDSHLRQMRPRYAARHAALVRALEHHAPEVQLGGLAAGFHVVATLPAHIDEDALIAAARDRSVGLYSLRTYCVDHVPPERQLVLGFGNLTESSIAAGIAAIADLLRA